MNLRATEQAQRGIKPNQRPGVFPSGDHNKQVRVPMGSNTPIESVTVVRGHGSFSEHIKRIVNTVRDFFKTFFTNSENNKHSFKKKTYRVYVPKRQIRRNSRQQGVFNPNAAQQRTMRATNKVFANHPNGGSIVIRAPVPSVSAHQYF